MTGPLTALDVFREGANLYPLIAGIALAGACALVSVLIVLKRLAFIGQGISHAGFGGVGLASFLAIGGFYRDLTIFAFCLATGLIIAALSRSKRVHMDTAIGVLLVAAMGFGFLLDQMRLFLDAGWYTALVAGRPMTPTSWEAILFGSILFVGVKDMWIAIGLSIFVLVVLGALFKEVVFYAFDETASRVFGVPATMVHYCVMIVIAALIVVSMKLAGLILVNALLVIPGATAMILCRRMGAVLIVSLIVGEVGMIAGYLLSFQIMGGRLPTGPFIVLVLALQFGAALLWRRLRRV